MKQKYIISFLLFFLPLTIFAQEGKDFILTMSGDTLYGEIKFSRSSKQVTFYRYGIKKRKTKFQASTISYFGLSDKKDYQKVYTVVKMHPLEEVFVEVLTKGKINLFYYDTSESKHYINGDRYRYFVSTSELRPIKISPRSYKQILKTLMKEHPELVKQLKNYEDVPRIVRKYNQA